MEHCTSAFVEEEQYRNDPRYIKIWLQYADKLVNKSELFKFLYKNKIGEELALFWIGWAWVCEVNGDYAMADKLYVKGCNKGAKPFDAMKARHKEFVRRMARLWTNHQEEEADGGGAEAPMQGNEEQRRSALSTLSKRALANNDRAKSSRRRGQENAGVNVRGGVSGTSGSSRGLGGASRGLSNGNSSAPNAAAFAVFVEPNFTRPVGEQKKFDELANVGVAKWKDFGTRKGRDRENMQGPSKWTESALPGTGGSIVAGARSRVGLGGPATSSIPIFVDDGFKQSSAEEAPQQEPAAAPKPFNPRDSSYAQQKHQPEVDEVDEELQFEEKRAQLYMQRLAAAAPALPTVNSSTVIPSIGIAGSGSAVVENVVAPVPVPATATAEAASPTSAAIATSPQEDRTRTLRLPVDMGTVRCKPTSKRLSFADARLPQASQAQAHLEVQLEAKADVETKPQAQAGDADENEDVTINTKLALEDLECMFSSPKDDKKKAGRVGDDGAKPFDVKSLSTKPFALPPDHSSEKGVNRSAIAEGGLRALDERSKLTNRDMINMIANESSNSVNFTILEDESEPVEVPREQDVGEQHGSRLGFSIYEEHEDMNNLNPGNGMSSGKGLGGGISIFQDPPGPEGSHSPGSHGATAADTVQPGHSLGFSIFSDSPGAAPAPEIEQNPPAAAGGVGFSIFQDTSAPPQPQAQGLGFSIFSDSSGAPAPPESGGGFPTELSRIPEIEEQSPGEAPGMARQYTTPHPTIAGRGRWGNMSTIRRDSGAESAGSGGSTNSLYLSSASSTTH
ncbi:unnamed protein product [Chrysoparadoxa australica]